MSVNGLDDPSVREAHEAAAAEPGGWFLLKYVSRDQLELLGRGNGGIVEVRGNIEAYNDISPVFGFLRYRRRNVILKYMPEACGQLAQARATVHFMAVCEQFAPYNTTFSISAAKELKDTKLSAACSLHAASGSSSSSTSSLRRRRLVEIAEEEEEERASKRQSLVQPPEERPPTPPQPEVKLNSELATSREHNTFSSSDEPPHFMGVPRPPSPAKSFDAVTASRRMSSQSTRPDLFSYSSYSYGGKQKVKLGPRPSLDVSGRPRTAAGFRPVSQIPAGFKLFSKNSKRGASPAPAAPGTGAHKAAGAALEESPHAESDVPDITFAATSIPVADGPPLQTVAEQIRPHTSAGARTTSAATGAFSALRTTNASAAAPTTSNMAAQTQAKMTPEKARLMKAMQLREKKKKMSMAPVPVPAIDLPKEEDVSVEETGPAHEEDDNRSTIIKADSGIVLEVSAASNDQISEVTQDSRPVSPILASSEPDQSTKASSLSESTDETVHVKQEDHEEHPEEPEARITNDESTDDVTDRTSEPTADESQIEGEISHGHEGPTVEDHIPEETAVDEVAKPAVEEEFAAAETPAPVGLPVSKFSASIPRSPEERDVAAAETMELQASQSPSDAKNEVDVPAAQLKIPKSKFSTQDLRAAASVTNAASPPSPPPLPSVEPTPERLSAGEASLHSRRSKRPSIEPINTSLDGERDEAIDDDESLMEELQSATIQEAKPMAVSKSPITPVFPSPQKTASQENVNRTVSNPVKGTLLTPADVANPARSMSTGAAYLDKITKQQSNGNLVGKKTNIGSSISQRIKALEKLSGAGSGETPKNVPNSTFFSVRKAASVREPSRSPSVLDKAQNVPRQTTPPSAVDTRDASPDAQGEPRNRSGSVASRLSMFESPNQKGRPESIQVTARIVRDPNQPFTKDGRKDPSEFSHLDLKQSQIEIDHQKAVSVPQPEQPKETIQERRMSKEKRRSESRERNGEEEDVKPRRSSLSIVKDFIKERRKSLTSASTDQLATPSPMTPGKSPSRPPSTHHNTSFPRRLSISSRRSSFSKDSSTTSALSPSMNTEASGSGDEKPATGDKKKSRTGRFIRRLSSSLSGSSRKNMTPTGISPTVREEDDAASDVLTITDSRSSHYPSTSSFHHPPQTHHFRAHSSSSSSHPSIVAYMGDVNVQFPDNLLWKRRSMCIDSQGFLILSPLQGREGAKGGRGGGTGTKRYHMGEFGAPFVPDVEVQELPNSVVLEFVEGGVVQVACEDRAGQLSVLHTLQDAHGQHSS